MTSAADVLNWAWRLYQASPPLLLAILIIASTIGFRHVSGRIDQVLERVESLEESAINQAKRLDQHEILINHAEEAAEDAQDTAEEVDEELSEAIRQNERRINQIRADRRAEGQTNTATDNGAD